MYSTPLSGGSGVAKSDVFFVASFHKEEEIRKKMRLGPDACEEDGRKHCLQIQAQELGHAFAEGVNRAFFVLTQYQLKHLGNGEAPRKWLRTTTNCGMLSTCRTYLV